MKEKKVLLLLLLVLLFSAGILGVIYLVTTRSQPQLPVAGITQSGVLLELSAVEMPTTVETICQPLEFRITMKNIGSEKLTLKDITDSRYKFVILEKSTYLSFLYTNTLEWGKPTLEISAFDELLPGKSTAITLKTHEVVGNTEDATVRNGFSALFQKGNGQAEFELSFQRIDDDNTVSIRSNKLPFTLNINAFESNRTEIGYLNKVCD